MPHHVRHMRNGDIIAGALTIDGNDAILYARAGDIRTIKWDLSDLLDTAITISTAAKSAGSLSVGTPTISAGVVTLTVTVPTGSDYADMTATLSSGEKISLRLQAIENTPRMSRDYAA